MSFPLTRLRRSRQSKIIRELFAETSFNPANDLIQPLFVSEGGKEEISSMPGIYRYDIENLLNEVRELYELGIKAIMLFPSVDDASKTADAQESYNANNILCRSIQKIRKEVPEILVIADVALDPYTNHGHDGVIDDKDEVLNDATVEILKKQALALVTAGCQAIAPSDMMDGRVLAIRQFLEDKGHHNVMIISYAAKYASNFYGPFRDAVASKKKAGIDKSGYQMDFRNSQEAICEISLDIEEGADAIIVKPAGHYLDIINKAAERFPVAMIGYQVSAEYSMLKLGAANGLFDFNAALTESLIAIKRAGASAIVSYAAKEFIQYHQDL